MLIQLPFFEIRFDLPSAALRPVFACFNLADDLGSTIGHDIRIGEAGYRNSDLAILRRILSLENSCIAAKTGATDIDNGNPALGQDRGQSAGNGRNENVLGVAFDNDDTTGKEQIGFRNIEEALQEPVVGGTKVCLS